jgi:SAM-dependent methyltransferase
MEPSSYKLMAAVEERHWWYRGRRRIIHSILSRHMKLDRGARVLEVGAGTGGNINLLRQFGKVDAAEFDEEARRTARQKTGCNVVACNLPTDLSVEEKCYELIVLFDVLEHIDDDVSTLRLIGEKIKGGGKVMLTVPALPWLWSRHDDLSHHKRRYTKSCLENACRNAGLEILEVGYFNSFLFPLVAVFRLLKNVSGSDRLDSELPHPFVNRILEAIFGFERHFLGWLKFPVGVSLYMVAQPAKDEVPLDASQRRGMDDLSVEAKSAV